jgi:flavin-dependent dehydrogenase
MLLVSRRPARRLFMDQPHILKRPVASRPEVLIIGAGPAGAAAAAVLADHGHRVLVLERERFPRYHIGESMLPFCYQPLDRLGLIPQLKASHFVKKYSVQFVEEDGRALHPLYFFSRYDRETVAQTWQVLRSEFDQLLVDNARRKGAEVREGFAVRELIEDQGRVLGVRTQDASGPTMDHFAPITLDCSGKEAFAAVRSGWRFNDPKLNKVAVWTYYEGARRERGIDEGATTLAMLPERGWFWYIPQHDDRVSVGVVAEGKYLSRGGVKSPEAMFQREAGVNPWMQAHLAPGRQVGHYFITSEYTHHAKYCYRDGLLLAGDAFCFLDPVFSSGLMLALRSGVLAGETVHEALTAGDLSPARFAEYGARLRRGIENMRRLIYAFYHPGFSFTKLVMRHPSIAGELTDVLAGNLDQDFSCLWRAISEIAELPHALPCGGAMPGATPRTI